MCLHTNCPHCQKALATGEHLLGDSICCKKCGHVFLVEETSSPLPHRIQSDLPAIPSLRHNRWKRILGLAGCGLSLFLLGGAVVLAIAVYSGRSRDRGSQQRDIDFGGFWPAPSLMGARFPEESSVTLHVAAVEDEYTHDAVYGKALLLADDGRGSIAGAVELNRATILVSPVRDPQEYARKIDFGTVIRIDGRTICIVAHKVEGPAANADVVTKILYHLKSPSSHRRREAAERLTKMAPNERREEVIKALQEALVNDTDFHARLSSRPKIAEAIGVWGTKDSVPFLLEILAGLVTEHDFFTRQAIYHALARFPDERTCEPIAQHLGDEVGDRHAAAVALKTMGPMAEKAVLKRLQHPDQWVRQTVCEILQAIGTKESLAALQREAKSANVFTSDAAQRALQAIKARQRQAHR